MTNDPNQTNVVAEAPVEKEKKYSLTKVQRWALKKIRDNKGSYFVLHIKPSGTRCYRLMGPDMSPIVNVRKGVIDRMVRRDFLKKADKNIVLPHGVV